LLRTSCRSDCVVRAFAAAFPSLRWPCSTRTPWPGCERRECARE
jgi:hypothetical protein